MTVSTLTSTPYQIQILLAQIWRENTWVDLPVMNATGTFQVGSAGTIQFGMSLDGNDPRTILYEGERIRMFSGLYGAPLERRFTGFVDSVQTTDSVQGTVRLVTASDHLQELKAAIILEPRVYDGIEPNLAIADAINQALQTGQLQLANDAGQALTNLSAYDTPNGNPILDAPQILNDDLSIYYLPQGVLASTMTLQSPSTTIMIPPVSGTNTFIELQIPFGYIIASTLSANLILTTDGSTLPPPAGYYYLDTYNGIAYFNNAQASSNYQFSCFYYSTPIFGYQMGTSVLDCIAAIMDKAGQSFLVDPNGKFHMTPAQLPRVPTRILGKAQYVQNGIQTNRDRRNVIVCEGWDGNCGGIIAAKAVLWEDTVEPPPNGLGKRAYFIVQDPAWKTQYAVDKAAYYAAQNIGRRGKVMTLTIIDDPTIQLNDTIGFIGTIPELANGDFFIVEQTYWQIGTFNGQQMCQCTVSGTLIPGQSTIYLGTATATTGSGNLDYSIDTLPIYNCRLSPPGGTTAANFSIFGGGLNLIYTVGALEIFESIDIYGSDGSHTIVESSISRAPSEILSLPMPSDAFTPGVFYTIYLWALDTNGNVGAFTSCIYALP